MGVLSRLRQWMGVDPARAGEADSAAARAHNVPVSPSASRHLTVSPSQSATSLDQQMMRRALELAREAAAIGEVPIGAVVYETATGRVLSEGSNRREIDHDPAAHAELIAIRAAAGAAGDWRLNRCTLVVTLEPCAMCAGLIVNARLGRLVYGAADPKAGATDTLYRLTMDPRLNHRVEPVAGVMGEECAAVLREFFRGLRAKP